MKFGVIYKLSVGENFIIGSTVQNPKDRISQYIRKLEKNSYTNSYVQNSFNKYGINEIKWEILQNNIPEDILECVEDIWIGSLCGRMEDKKGGMNMRDAHRTRFSQETRTKISQTIRNNGEPICKYSLDGYFLEEYSTYKEAGEKNNIHTSDIFACCSGKIMSSGGYQWRPFKTEKIEKYTFEKAQSLRKPVNQLSMDNEFIKSWVSMSEASKQLNLRVEHISGVCSGKRKSCGGFKWQKS